MSWTKFQFEIYFWTRPPLIGDETVISLQRTKVYVFSDSGLCFGKTLQEQSCRNPIREKATEILMLSTESRLNSSGTFSRIHNVAAL